MWEYLGILGLSLLYWSILGDSGGTRSQLSVLQVRVGLEGLKYIQEITAGCIVTVSHHGDLNVTDCAAIMVVPCPDDLCSVLARNLLKGGGAGVAFRAAAGVPKAARAVRTLRPRTRPLVFS